jgi:tripartite ATP-independent transporter DctM subunit
MNPELIGLLGLVVLMILLAAGMWIGAATALVGFIGVFLIRGWEQALSVAEMIPYQNIINHSFTMIPMFMLMGLLVTNTGIGSDMYTTAHKWIGQIKGGLASASVLACAGLGAITGGGMTGIMILSKSAVPEMRRYKYDDRLITGSIAAGSTIATLIPPSIPFILYGLLTEQSVGKLFIAGVIPGILEAVIYIATIYLLCTINPSLGPAGPKTSLKEKIFSLKDTWAIVALLILILGGIYGGVFTPTEAGAVGSFGAIIIAVVARRLTFKKLRDSFVETGLMTGTIVIMIAGVNIFASFMTVSKLPFLIGDFVAGLQVPKFVIILLICLMYVILGCFLDGPPMIMLTLPVIFPIIQALGLNPIWFGVVIVKVMEIGLITPPVGLNCFVISGFTGIPASTVFRGCVPFVIADVIHLMLILFIPALSLWLPSLM